MPFPNDPRLAESYLQAAHRALDAAQYSFDGGYHDLAVNRAYYAFYYAAGALLISAGEGRRRHSDVLAAFRYHFVKSGSIEVEYSDTYGAALEARETADYDVDAAIGAAKANDVLVNARRFVARIEAYLHVHDG